MWLATCTTFEPRGLPFEGKGHRLYDLAARLVVMACIIETYEQRSGLPIWA